MLYFNNFYKIPFQPGAVFPASSGFSENDRSVNIINRAIFVDPDDEKLNKLKKVLYIILRNLKTITMK